MLKEIELAAEGKEGEGGDALVYFMCKRKNPCSPEEDFLSNFSEEQLNIMLRWLSLVAMPLYGRLCVGDIEEAEQHIHDILERWLFRTISRKKRGKKSSQKQRRKK